MTEEKLTPAVDGSKVLPFDRLKAELYYPKREENVATTETVHEMAVEVAKCLIKEMLDPKKATHEYLTAAEGKCSWGYTSDADHAAYIGKMATNDNSESPFAALTRQLQEFGRVLGSHAAAIGHARMSGDFKRDIFDSSMDGAYHKLPPKMRESLLEFALKKSPEVRKAEKVALEKQREAKKKRVDAMRERKLEAASEEYVKALTYVEMYHSPACWRTEEDVHENFDKLGSEAAKKKAVKEQIRIRVLGFGWKDLHVAWSRDGVEFSAEYLRDKLIETIIPEQSERDIPDIPPVQLPSRGNRRQLGTKSKDLEKLDAKRKEKEVTFVELAHISREDQEMNGETDRYEKLQPMKPPVDEKLIDKRIEQLWEFFEPDGTANNIWCAGVVVAVKKNSKVHIQWEEKYLREGDPAVTQERLLSSKWNKHVIEGWRMVKED